MRILHVVESLDPKLGGPSVCAPSLACAQSALGDDVTLVSYADSSTTNSSLADHLSALPNVNSVNFVYLNPRDRQETLLAGKARDWLETHIPTFDIVHLHGIWRPILATAASICFKAARPYVLQPHGMLDTWSMRQKHLKKQLAWHLSWQRIANRAAFVHVLNGAEEMGIRKLGVTAQCFIVGNGIFREHLDRIADIPNDKPKEPYILFLSRLHAKKGLDVLAKAYEIYRARGGNARLRVVGPEEGAGPSFSRAIEETGLSFCVDVEPPVYGNAKYALMRNASCFCLPSYQEGFSVALLEAAACELPLVITSACNFPEIADAAAGQITDADPHAIAEGLLFYTAGTHEESRRAAGARGRKLVTERYTWEAIATQLRRHYLAYLTAENAEQVA